MSPEQEAAGPQRAEFGTSPGVSPRRVSVARATGRVVAFAGRFISLQ